MLFCFSFVFLFYCVNFVSIVYFGFMVNCFDDFFFSVFSVFFLFFCFV